MVRAGALTKGRKQEVISFRGILLIYHRLLGVSQKLGGISIAALCERATHTI
jgi:hypothetical protein